MSDEQSQNVSDDSPEPQPTPAEPSSPPTQPAEAAPESASAGDVATEALEAAQAAISDLNQETQAADGGTALNLPSLSPDISAEVADGLSLLSDVQLNVTIELGRTRMLVEDVLKLGDGAVVELDKLAGDPVDIYVNERQVARGEVLVLNDNFCVRVSEILAPAAAVETATDATVSADQNGTSSSGN